MRALVVEDDSVTRRILEHALEHRGHTVTSTPDAETALDLHRAESFPLMLIDWNLSGMDGIELCRRVRAGAGGHDVVIIVATGRDRAEDLVAALDAGASDYLVKPLSAALLRTRLIIAERLVADVAQRKNMQAQLVLADRMASLGTLAAGLVHQINNPLAYIIANLDFLNEELQRGPDRNAELGDLLRDARDGAERVRLLVRNLRAFSDSSSEKLGPVELQKVIDVAIQMAWNEIRHRARLVKEYGPTPPVMANEARLAQVYLSLLLNAAQSIPDGAVSRNEIRVVTWLNDKGYAVTEVRDTGSGLGPEAVSKIFDPVLKASVQSTAGLGLAICRSIVASFKGEITVESVENQGSVFRVSLPIVDLKAFAEPPAGTPAPSLQRRARVLVIDDEPLIVASVRRALASEHEVIAVEGARDALNQFQDGQRFDVVLCDIMMPDLTAMDLYAELGKVAPEQRERILFITGGTFTPRAQSFLAQVPNPRLEKPFDLQDLRTLVRHILSTSPAQ